MFGEANCIVNDANILQLKLFQKPKIPDEVFDHQVPVQIQDLQNLMEEDWDLTLKRIVPFINGVNHVDKIAQLSETNIGFVRDCVRQLLSFGLITMIDIFLYSNEYELTAKIADFLSNSALKEECLEFVWSDKNTTKTNFPTCISYFRPILSGQTDKSNREIWKF
eukprot:TRINITY_DN3908_c0_g1_i3.p1 TRINITY_DN3908_c0_g1~~TRINITY_DN3908_c0_g1_i3.p1  ORF type:complete len:165 (-),score=18.06 TRINITY_DN3908_c0_g1_i3:329-823(-)